MGDFLPPAALKTIALEYQQGLLDRLNDEVRGTDLEHKSIVQTVIEASAHPDQVLTFNYASEALNNSFFLRSLMPPVSRADGSPRSNEDDISPTLRHAILRNFKSLEQLKSNFGGTALGMFTPGWVWLVCDKSGYLAVLPTFGSETLLIRSRKAHLPPPHLKLRPQSHNDSIVPPSSPSSGLSQSAPPLQPSSPARSLSHSAIRSAVFNHTPSSLTDSEDVRDHKNRPGSEILPLMCLSVHEHAWMSAGYGIWGKEEYVKRVWPVINWQAVSEAFDKFHDGRAVGRR